MTALEALRNYQQADEDGVMVLVSRQACDECVAEIERLREDVALWKDRWEAERRDALAAEKAYDAMLDGQS